MSKAKFQNNNITTIHETETKTEGKRGGRTNSSKSNKSTEMMIKSDDLPKKNSRES